MTIAVFLLIIAVVLFAVAAFGVRAPWLHLGWAGAAFTVGALIAERL